MCGNSTPRKSVCSQSCTRYGMISHIWYNYCQQVRGRLVTLMDEMLAETAETKEQLFKQISLLLNEVHSLSEELKSDPETSNILGAPLIDVQSGLKSQVEALKQKKEQRLKYLKELWNKLNEEIKLYKQKHSENIAKYVEKVREELRELWDLCKIDKGRRKKFRFLYVQSYDESLLMLHDMKVERLRQYYNKNRLRRVEVDPTYQTTEVNLEIVLSTYDVQIPDK